MPGRRCAVFGCNNSKVVPKREGNDTIFHNFPKGKDTVSIGIVKEWMQQCKRSDKFNPDTSQICSIHLTQNDYERDLHGLPTLQSDCKILSTTLSTLDSTNSSSDSSFSSTEATYPTVQNSEETTYDALEYIAGYLAKKFRKDLPHLGDPTRTVEPEHSYSLPSWVQQLSYGGLIKPSSDWLNKIIKWNNYFQNFHGESLRKGPFVTKKLSEKIKKKDKMPMEVITAFCKLRLIIRINYKNRMNSKVKEKLKRKFVSSTPNEDVERKKRRKFKKLID